MTYPNLTITFLIEHQNQFLLIKRGDDEANFSSLWAFPGGKVEYGETVVQTIEREIREETGLELTDECNLLDTYYFKKTVGLAFLVRATNGLVRLAKDIPDFQWISSLEELQKFNRIKGIDYHLKRAIYKLQQGQFDSLEEINLTEDKY